MLVDVVGSLLLVAAAAVGAALIIRAAVHARRGVGVAVGATRPRQVRPVWDTRTRAGRTLVGWRFGRLLSAGVDARLALRLAERPDIDIHAVVALVRRGCPAPLAARISEPLPGRVPGRHGHQEGK